MKISISLFIILLVAFGAHSQDPAIIWQNTIGGSEGDFSMGKGAELLMN